MNDCCISSRGKKIGTGIFLVLLGILFLGHNLGMIPEFVENIIFTWPMILVAIALFHFCRGNFTTGIIFLAIGSFFMLPKLFSEFENIDFHKFWPILLILIGIAIIIKRKKKPIDYKSASRQNYINDEYFEDVSIFGGGTTIIESQNLKGGRINSIFGGGEINLSKAKLAPEGALVEVVIIFGGNKIYIPREWNVKIEMVSIFGGFVDKRHLFPETNSGKILKIKGVTIFGGGEIVTI